MNVTGTASVSGPTIDLTSLITITDATILHADGLLSYTGAPTFLLNGETIQDSDRIGGVNIYLAADDHDMVLSLDANYQNKAITWTGATDNNWNISTENWVDAGTTTATTFLDGDAVTFDNLAGTPGTIKLGGSGKTVASMTVTGWADWTFDGNILADASKSNLAARPAS